MTDIKTSIRYIKLFVDDFVVEYYHRTCHLPMFYIVERFLKSEITSDHFIGAANALSPLFSDFAGYDIADFANKLHISKERVRQLATTYKKRILTQDYNYCDNPDMTKNIFSDSHNWGYLIERTQSLPALTTQFVDKVLQEENSTINKNLAMLILAGVLKKDFVLLGYSLNQRTKRTNYWKNLYLINKIIADQFNFDKFIEMAYYYEFTNDNYLLYNLYEYANIVFKDAWKSKDHSLYVNEVSKIIGGMLISELGKKIDGRNRIALRGRKKTIADMAYDIITRNHYRMSVMELVDAINFIRNSRILKLHSIIQAIRNDTRFIVNNEMVSLKLKGSSCNL